MTTTTTTITPSPPISSTVDDSAYFLRDAVRPVILVKVPKSLMDKQWAPAFADQDNRKHPLFTVDGTMLCDGCVVTTIPVTTTGNGEQQQQQPLRFKLRLDPTPQHQKSRIISADVGSRGDNVRFEGIVQQTATLTPIPDDQYLQRVTQRSREADVKTRFVTALSLKDQARQLVDELKTRPEQITADEDDEAIIESEKRRMLKRHRSANVDGGDAAGGGGAAAAAAGSGSGGDALIATAKRHKKVDRPPTTDEIRKKLFELFNKVDVNTGQVMTRWTQKEIRVQSKFSVNLFKSTLDQIAIFRDGKYELKPEFRGSL